MIKPIVYHDIREKKKLEAELFSKIHVERRMAMSQEFIDLFSNLRRPDDRKQMEHTTKTAK